MRPERRRALRQPFTAKAEIFDETKNLRASSRVKDLSLYGCYVEMENPLPRGTRVLLEMFTESEFLETHATVVYFEPEQGMGLTFTDMPEGFASVLSKWLEQGNG